jgi:hypothetical protein
MKEGIKSLLVYSLIAFFVFSILNQAIILPENPSYILLTVLILTFTIMISCPILSFLTVKCKFPTFFLMTTLLLIGILYLLKLFMVGFYIDTYMFEGLDLGGMQIAPFEVVPLLSIALFSVVTSFICSLYRELDSSKGS